MARDVDVAVTMTVTVNINLTLTMILKPTTAYHMLRTLVGPEQ